MKIIYMISSLKRTNTLTQFYWNTLKEVLITSIPVNEYSDPSCAVAIWHIKPKPQPVIEPIIDEKYNPLNN